MATSYFKEVYSVDPSLDASEVLDLFHPVVSFEGNEKLCSEFSDEEISDALFQTGPLKAPGPDGFPARFFQRNWDTLKDNVVKAVKKFFRTGLMPMGVK